MEISSNTKTDEEILRQAMSGNIAPTPEGGVNPEQLDPVAGAESCLVLISTARNMFGVTAEIPSHIQGMWKNAYIQVAKKYGFDLLGAWGPEISMVVASYLLILDTKANMPKPEEVETKADEVKAGGAYDPLNHEGERLQ